MKKINVISLIAIMLLSVTIAWGQWTVDEGFEAGAIPASWTVYDVNNDGMQWGAYENATVAVSHSGDWSAVVECYGSDGNDWLITPQTAIQSGDSFIFYARSWYGTEDMNVKLSTSGNSIGDFDVTLESVTGLGDAYVEYAYDLSSYTGQNIYLAIEWIQETYALIVDDVTIGGGAPTTCPDPSALYATNILDTQADCGWTENGSATVWSIEVGAPGFTPGTTAYIQAYTGVTSNPYTGMGLTASTDYEFYVQADCGERETSNWAGPEAFSTPCGTVTSFPFIENFDAAQTTPDCWINDDPTDPWEFDTDCGHGADYDHTTGSGNFAWLDDSNPNDNPSNFDSPPLNVTSLTTPYLSFWYWIGDATNASILYIDVYDGSVWNEGVVSYTELQEWGVATVDISAYSSTATQIRFRAMEDVGGYVGDICVDDVSVYEVPTCPEPSDLSTSSITQTTASLGWTNNASASLWDIELGVTGFSPTGTPTQTGVTNPYTYGSLSANTTYGWYVRADCGSGDYSNWTGPNTFTTLCSSFTAPFSENFDTTDLEEMPNCWFRIENGSGYVKVSDTSSNSAPNNLRMYNGSSITDVFIAATPQLSDLTSQLNQIRFMGRAATYEQDLIIGTMSDPTDETTFTAFQTVTLLVGVYTEYTVVFDDSYTLTDEYIAFKHLQIYPYRYLNIDDFVYEEISGSCPAPINVQISIDGTDVTIFWDAVTGAETYKVYSSTDPYGTFTEDTTGVLTGEQWVAPSPAVDTFYHITADTGSSDAISCANENTEDHSIKGKHIDTRK